MPQQIRFARQKRDKSTKSKTNKMVEFEDVTLNDDFFVEITIDAGEVGPRRGWISEDQTIELRTG